MADVMMAPLGADGQPVGPWVPMPIVSGEVTLTLAADYEVEDLLRGVERTPIFYDLVRELGDPCPQKLTLR